MYSGSAPKCEWTETLPEEEDPNGEETSVNEEDEQAMTRGGVEPMYSGSARKREKTETLPEEEGPSGQETCVNEEDKEATTSGEDPSGEETSVDEEDEEVTTSGGVKPIYSGTEPKCYWTPALPAKEEDASGAETSLNEEDEKGCLRLVQRIYPSELEIGRLIAEGGQADIFLAKYLKTQQDVVVKTYRCRVNSGELRRLMDSVMKAFGHDFGLCRMIGVSVDEKDRVSTVMELMGGDLRHLLEDEDSRLSYEDRKLILWVVASGMKKLHDCGIIHKDLKASNVLVRAIPFGFTNEWTWNDFKLGDYESSDSVVGGTGFFRAPEVLRAVRDGTNIEYSTAVDVYGFGMLCYEVFSGKYPFEGHPLSDYDLVLSGKRPDISDSSWKPWMRTLLQRCWDENPLQRPGWDEIYRCLIEEDGFKCSSHQPVDELEVMQELEYLGY
jgi:tRNA A-37 threonylcarbamoyl transferase component Bud32